MRWGESGRGGAGGKEPPDAGGQGPPVREPACPAQERGLRSRGKRQLLPSWGVCLTPGLCHITFRVLDCLLVSPRHRECTEN